VKIRRQWWEIVEENNQLIWASYKKDPACHKKKMRPEPCQSIEPSKNAGSKISAAEAAANL
jgi:hypothetical protein